MLSPIEKTLLARVHGVSAWLDEAVSSLATCTPIPALGDLATLGWETVARILWIRNDAQYTHCFKGDAMKCMHCSSSLSLTIGSRSIYSGGCGHIVSGDTELTFLGSASPIPGTPDFSVSPNQIQCQICKRTPFYSIAVTCNSCSYSYHHSDNPSVQQSVRLIARGR